jgi:hypothetical protein
MLTLPLMLLAVGLAQEVRTVTYEFPEEESVQGELLKPSASYILPAAEADARPCPRGHTQLDRRRGALERRPATADRTASLGDLDRCEARLLERALWERWDVALANGEEPPQDNADQAAIDALQRRAIARYDRALVSTGLSQPDRVWLARGQAALGLRDEELAWASFSALLEQCPGSPLAPLAQLQLGELAFAAMEPADALPYYQALAGTQHELATMGAYKQAWCLLMTGEEAQGIRLLMQLAEGPDGDPITGIAGEDLERLGTLPP